MLMLMTATASLAQNIRFRIQAPDAITLTKQGSIDMAFDGLVLDSDMVSTIAIGDTHRMAVLAIDAPAHYELTVYIEPANNDRLLLNGTESDQWIPFTLEFAYANPGYPVTETYIKALTDAVEIPTGLGQITFPVSSRASRLLPPPPSAKYGNYKVSKQRAFLFFYGRLGSTNAGNNVVAGTYETTIEVTIDFTSHEH